MTLRSDEKDWIRAEIKDAINALKPRGWRKALQLLREWGVLGTIIAVIVTLLGITLGALYQSFSHLTEETQFRTRTDDRLTTVEADLLALRAAQTALRPTDTKSQSEAKEVLATARSKSIKLPLVTVEDVGKSFVDASKTEANAWPVALQFINYRSFLNQDEQPTKSLQLTPVANGTFTLNFQVTPKYPGQTFAPPNFFVAGGTVSQEDSARLEDLSKPQPGSGYKYIVVLGNGTVDGIKLDNSYMKNVVVISAVIFYQGGPVRLENVYFVNCTFKFGLTPRGRDLSDTLLASAGITFPLGLTQIAR